MQRNCILQYFGEKKCVFMNRLVNDLLMLIHMIADSSLFMFGRKSSEVASIHVPLYIKWGASSRWSFVPKSAGGSIGTMTMGKTHPTV